MNVCLPRQPRKGLAFDEPTKTQVHLRKFADINYMIERALGGDSSVYRRGSFVDVSGSPEDFQDFLNIQRKALEAYESLPVNVRARYTTPEAFFAAANNEESRAEFARLGLLINRTPEGPVMVQIVTPEGSKDSSSAACTK